jgi:hypothetical protein
MPSAQLDDALAQLVGAELIYRRGAPPDAEYTFYSARPGFPRVSTPPFV